jgi:uroporphyrinogen-III decarboxylase
MNAKIEPPEMMIHAMAAQIENFDTVLHGVSSPLPVLAAPTDLAKAAEVCEGKAVLLGNVNTNLFYSGTREQMEQAIKECLAVAPKDSGFILASGCEVPGIAPPEKVDWFMELINELCKLHHAL